MPLTKLFVGPPSNQHPVTDTAWRICEYIFSLIEKNHKGFTAAVDSSCNTDRLLINWQTIGYQHPTRPRKDMYRWLILHWSMMKL